MAERTKLKEIKREARHIRLRKKITGTAERPRLCVHRSLNNISAQMVDDVSGRVLFGMSTLNKEIRAKCSDGGTVEAAKILGQAFSAVAKSKGVAQVAFDRGGYMYHGRVKAFADAAREGGLAF